MPYSAKLLTNSEADIRTGTAYLADKTAGPVRKKRRT
jgi:hypothetical protein